MFLRMPEKEGLNNETQILLFLVDNFFEKDQSIYKPMKEAFEKIKDKSDPEITDFFDMRKYKALIFSKYAKKIMKEEMMKAGAIFVEYIFNYGFSNIDWTEIADRIIGKLGSMEISSIPFDGKGDSVTIKKDDPAFNKEGEQQPPKPATPITPVNDGMASVKIQNMSKEDSIQMVKDLKSSGFKGKIEISDHELDENELKEIYNIPGENNE